MRSLVVIAALFATACSPPAPTTEAPVTTEIPATSVPGPTQLPAGARDIVWGDALTLKTAGENPSFIVFSEWAAVGGRMLKRRDFTFRELLQHESLRELPLFSDLGEDVFIPTPEKEYPPCHFMEIANVQKQL